MTSRSPFSRRDDDPRPRSAVAFDGTTLHSRLSGALWGYLIGDAIGGGSFRRRRDPDGPDAALDDRGDLPAGTWGEGGTLLLALLDSLLEAGFDTADQAERIIDAYRDNAYVAGGWRKFEIGEQLRHAIRAIEHGVPAEECGSRDERLQGNGALKRILALALVERETADAELVDRAIRSSRIIDGTDGGQVSAALYVLAVRGLLAGETDRARVLRDAVRRLNAALAARGDGPGPADVSHTAELRHFLDWRARHGAASPDGAFSAAWEAFAGATSVTDAIERSMRHATETATIAALAGGLAGAYWGLDGIPSATLLNMRGRRIAGRLLEGLIVGPSPTARTASRPLLAVDWLDLAAVPGLGGGTGRLGMRTLPGIDPHRRRGVRPRDLERDATQLREVERVDLVFLLVLDHELAPLGPTAYREAFGRTGIELIRHPIPDFEVPSQRDAFQAALRVVEARLRAGRSVVIACSSSRGRTVMAVGSLLRNAGLSADETMAFVRAARPGAIETPAQETFIREWEPSD